MKRVLFSLALLFLTSTVFSQVVFDLGLKAGLNFSKLNTSDLTTDGGFDISLDDEAITKMHWGAFGRVGFGRLFVQPEVYFTKKGGDVSNDILNMAAGFDYSAVDVPLLLGFKIIKGKTIDLKVIGGPLFSFVTDADFDGDTDYFDEEFINDNLFGYQVGIGVDVLFITFDMRYEHSTDVYEQPGTISGNANTFILSVGFKIL